MIMPTLAQHPAMIEVDNDTTINVREALNLPDTTFLYGEKYGEKQYGGSNNGYFIINQVTPNNYNGIEVLRDSNYVIQVKIDTLNLEEGNCTLKFKCAFYDSIDKWCPSDENIKLLIIKKKTDEAKTVNIDPLLSPVDSAYVSKMIDKNNDSLFIDLYKFSFVLILAIIACVAYLFKRYSKQIQKEKEEVFAEVQRLLRDKLEPKEDKKGGSDKQLTEYDIECLIDETISRHVSKQYPLHVSNDVLTDVKPTDRTNITSSIDTDNVIFDMDSNSFSIGETDIKIFRIYSKGDEYFYSIIDNQNIREEFLNMIGSYSSCVSVKNPGFQNPKGFESYVDGKLIKIGDNKYLVDPNNKLELNLV